MKTISFFRVFAFVTMAFAFVSCTFAQRSSRTFDVNDFESVEARSSIDVEIKQGSYFSVIVEGRSSDLDEVRAEVVDNKLILKRRSGVSWSFRNRELRATIVMPTLKGIYLSGASDGYLNSFNNIRDLSIDLSGASDLRGEFNNADNVKLKASGASDAILKGTANRISVHLSGSSDLKAYDLSVVDARIQASGASDSRLTVTGTLEANASGASDINYRGTPRVRTQTSGASDVRGN
jgi:hypothetical protein